MKKGKRILELQLSLALMNGAIANPITPPPDPYGRVPFQHPALEGLEALTRGSKRVLDLGKELPQLAYKYELDSVIRWKPKQVY